MILPDVNVLINAFRKDSEHHAICRTWLDAVVAGEARFGMSPLALNAVVRITTHVNFTSAPSTLEEAFGFCEDLLGQPHREVVEPGGRHWDIFRRLCLETGTRGRRVTDAWFAALAIEWGCEWVTLDRDFARFPGLRWRVPAVDRGGRISSPAARRSS
jgi:toxin-antitoxin system PIN domain toxin